MFSFFKPFFMILEEEFIFLAFPPFKSRKFFVFSWKHLWGVKFNAYQFGDETVVPKKQRNIKINYEKYFNEQYLEEWRSNWGDYFFRLYKFEHFKK